MQLVVALFDGLTVPGGVLGPVLSRLIASGPEPLLVSEWPQEAFDGMARSAGGRAVAPDSATLPDLTPLRGAVGDRVAFMADRTREDTTLRRLGLPGSGGTFQWDRLQWFLADRDLRPFVDGLPWRDIDAVTVVGGPAAGGPLGSLVTAAARRRDLAVTGVPLGALTGRWAPVWMHGCTELVLGDDEEARELLDAGCGAAVRIDEALGRPAVAFAPLDDDAEQVVLDVTVTTNRRLLRRALAPWLAARPRVRSLLLPTSHDWGGTLEHAFVDGVAGLPVTCVSGDALQHALAGASVISFEPYRLVWCAPLVDRPRVAALPDEVAACHGALPARLRPALLSSETAV